MNATVGKLNPRKSPLQGRSRATCEAVMEAAARILEQDGRQGLTTNHVAERAGISVGSLYQYYPGKEAILAALIRQMRREMLADFEAAVVASRDANLAGTAKALVRAAVKHHLRRPALAQALEREEADLPLDEETMALKAKLRALVIGVLAERGVGDAETVAFDLIAMCHGMVEAAVQTGERDFDGLCRRLDRAVLGYLGAPGAA
ncbi:TetR/AcrR family transcriptional regulator [Nitratireductor mangrovi]|uniref:TetR/AcrR family transcriptional regulator n=1 Tax=Nitratireductor mangrovi TaxID=2599600 RepID=A0A5B8KYT0_9HYPH|nr:TetR/AcrR family transcriptional regulator [Nitratireductor mangrovi]QDZ00600.1 TetR/AcrR family transcriptional regulator [Nitratireductor mangrovi]